MVKKIIDTTKKQGSEFAKTAGKRIVQKIAEAKKKKGVKKKKLLFHQRKNNRSLMAQGCFSIHIKMEYQKIINLLGNIPDKVPRLITKKWIEVHVQCGDTYNSNKQIRFKTSM